MLNQAEEHFKQQCTFKPQILPTNQPPDLERWKKLSSDRNEVYKQRHQQKSEQEILDLQKNCPFQPNTKRSLSRPKTANSDLEIRLMHEADRRREKRERMKRQRIEQEMEDCTFRPNINRKTSAPSIVNVNKLDCDRVPLHDRA